MKRLIDVIIAVLLIVLLAPVIFLTAAAVYITSPGPVLYWSDRVGRNNLIFRMPKFRTMQVSTPAVATHLLTDSSNWLSPIGPFLRKTSLDELPQLVSILIGDMSLVGPRPALFNQFDLIALRTERGVQTLTPGLTGWAQINGRDDLSITKKVDYDVWYLENRSIWLDFRIMLVTIFKVLQREGIQH